MSIEIAIADPQALRPALEEAVGGDGTVRQQSDYRDFSILEVAVTTVTTGALGVVFDLVKEYLKGKLPDQREKPAQAISIRVGDVVVTVDPAQPQAEIDAAIEQARRAAEG